MSANLLDSLKFRLHVRNILQGYVKQHCTKDYLTFTEDVLSEFVDDLQQVPVHDPYSLTIPPEPFDTLSDLYSLPLLPEHDEVLQLSKEALGYLKETIKKKVGNSRTDRVVMNGSYGPPLPEEPLYPALTRRARQNTKKLGQRDEPPLTLKGMIDAHGIGVVEVEPVQETVVDFEDTLQLKIQIDPEEAPAVRSLLQHTMNTLRPEKTRKNKYLDPAYLRRCFPPMPEYYMVEEPFMPMFSRRGERGPELSTAMPFSDFKSLVENESAPLKPVDTLDSDGDISRQNLVIVDGWETIRSSPPSTPISRCGDELDELDDIRFPSSPNTTPPRVFEIENAKMDDVLIPRSRRIGGSGGVAPHMLHGKTFKTFLLPLLSQPHTEVEESQKVERVPSPIASSVLGQPPSALGVEEEDGTESFSCDLDLGLQKLWEGHGLEQDFIMNETIDEKETCLMDVPDLPQPNEFSKDWQAPRSFRDLVVITNEKRYPAEDEFPPQRFLKTVKGCQSLGLALSWVPFTTDKQLPSVPEVVDVVEIFPPRQELSLMIDMGSVCTQAAKLVDSVTFPDACYERKIGHVEDSVDKFRFDDVDEFHMLLNRRERKRVAKVERRMSDGRRHTESDDGERGLSSSAVCHPEMDEDSCDGLQDDERPPKRLKLEIQHERDHHEDEANFYYEDEETALDCANSTGFFDENKENWPLTSSLSTDLDLDISSEIGQPLVRCGSSPGHGDFSVPRLVEAEESFDSLSFGTRRQADDSLSRLQLEGRSQECLDAGRVDSGALLGDTNDRAVNPQSRASQAPLKLAEFNLAYEPDLALRSLGISAFAHLRAKKISMAVAPVVSVPSPHIPSETVADEPRQPGPPLEIYDTNTISLPDTITVAQSVHRYMASVQFIQKHALVRALYSKECAVEIVERQTLGGVDLILDTKTAVVFLNLFSLPSQCQACVDRVAKQSWKFGKLLVVFEAYSELSSRKGKKHKLGFAATTSAAAASFEPYAYTPPIIKAVKKFRRDVSIAEGCGTKRGGSIIRYAFADTVEEAALLTRMYGDWAEAEDETNGAIWGERVWLDQDYLEDEEANLISLRGMNNFSVAIILCQISLQEFIDLSPQERIDAFGSYVGRESLMEFNEDLESRFVALRDVQMSSSD